MYKAVLMFSDLYDNGYRYHPGDTFPRSGMDVPQERIVELSTANNRRGKPLIAQVEKPRPTRKRVKKDD